MKYLLWSFLHFGFSFVTHYGQSSPTEIGSIHKEWIKFFISTNTSPTNEIHSTIMYSLFTDRNMNKWDTNHEINVNLMNIHLNFHKVLSFISKNLNAWKPSKSKARLSSTRARWSEHDVYYQKLFIFFSLSILSCFTLNIKSWIKLSSFSGIFIVKPFYNAI